jgi:hypothetical protein
MEMFESVPAALRIKRNWCVHRTDGQKAKVPHAPGGWKLQWSIPANWINFVEAKKAYQDGLSLPEGHKCRFEGLGFFVSREKDAQLDIYAVDLDDCVKGDVIDQWAKDVLSKLNSYSEISPSGTGVHVFVKGMLPLGSKNTNDQMEDKNRIEVFTDKHHVTITGNRLADYPETIEDRSEIIAAIYNEVMKVKKAKKADEKKAKGKKSRVIYDCREEAKKKYVAAAIEDEISILKGTPEGGRNIQLNRSAFAIGQFVGARHLSEREAIRELERAARAAGMTEKDGIEATIRSGLEDGMVIPREIPEGEPFQTSLPQITVMAEKPKVPQSQIEDEAPKKQAIANVLVKIATKNCIELWHTPEGECYITVTKNSHKEHYKLSSRQAKIWLGKQGHELMDKVIAGSTIKDAVNVLEGKAIYEGKEYELATRKAQIGDKIYVDLGDVTWKAVEIDRFGWRIIEDCPVKFRRSKNSLPLPMPEHGGEIDDLRGLINASDNDNWILTLAWLSQAFWCKGPYAHMYLRGQQGTLKTYMMKMLKTISDPSTTTERNLTKSEQDIAIAIGSESIPCFGNLSGISNGIADLFCIASTGGSFAKRALYTDNEEAVTKVKCILLMNGIDDLGQRGDLLDRTIVLDLEKVETRRTEEEVDAEIEEKKAKLFGCLLDMTVLGLDRIDSIELENPPRMADFAKWASACLGDAAEKFIEIYTATRESSSIELAEINRLPAALYSFVMNQPDKMWKGSASLLLANINHYAGIIPGHELEDWPTTPDKMGSELRRFSPSLEAKGIVTKYKKTNGKRTIELTVRAPSVPEETPKKPDAEDTRASRDTIDSLNLKVKQSNSKDKKEKSLAKHSDPSVPESPDSDNSDPKRPRRDPTGKKEVSLIEQDMIRKMEEDQAREAHFTTPEKNQSIAEKALNGMILNKGLITPFRLSMAIKAMGGDMPPKESEAYMVSLGWQSALPSWIKP